MLRKGWNFHADVAIQLERIALQHYKTGEHINEKIYNADAIESGRFAEVMIILLRERTEMANKDTRVDQFSKDCSSYFGIRGNSIPKETAQELFERFKEIYKV